MTQLLIHTYLCGSIGHQYDHFKTEFENKLEKNIYENVQTQIEKIFLNGLKLMHIYNLYKYNETYLFKFCKLMKLSLILDNLNIQINDKYKQALRCVRVKRKE